MIMLSVHDQQEASTVTLPRYPRGVVFEETGRSGFDPATVPVELAGDQPPAPPRFGVDYQLGDRVTVPVPDELRGILPGASPEDAVDRIFEQHCPDLAVRPVSGGEVYAVPVDAAPVVPAPRHAAEEPEAELSPLVEQLLNDAVQCGACGDAWPCGKDDGGAPYVPGEQDAASGEPDPLVFQEVVEGRPYGSWDAAALRARLERVVRSLAEVEAEVLAAVVQCETDTRRLGAARREERFGRLREELVAVFAAAASGELVDGPLAAAGGVVDSPVDADHAPNGNVLCEFVVGGHAEVPAGEPDGYGPDGEPLIVVDGVEHGPEGDVTYNEDAVSKPYTARCWCGLDFTTSSHDGAEEDRQSHLDHMAELAAAGGERQGMSGGEQ